MPTTPPPDRVFVEQFPEPITGWAMLGVGAVWDCKPSGPLEVEVRYESVPRVQAPVEVTPTGYRFGVQLPLEPGITRITVILRSDSADHTLFDDVPATLKPRSAATLPSTPVPRWLSPAVTLGKSVASGEVFSGGWWAARARRYRDLATKARQKVRDKLLIRSRYRPRSTHDAYVDRTRLTDLAHLRTQATRFRFKPTFSILTPVFNVDPKWLAEAIESVRNQAYPHWELCLADDASTNSATLAYLNRLPTDPRIKLVRRPTNGHICAATNSAAELASGEFVALLDNDDVLAPHALFAVAELLQSHPDADLIYSDEDKITADDVRYDPQFKPDWSPELLLSYNYVNHFTVLRRALFEKVGRFRVGYEGSQDHDLLLRVTEQTDRVHHIPEILYHWRALPTATASAAGVKPYVHTSGRKAVEDALTRRKVSATLHVPPFAEQLGLPILALDGPDDGPAVAIIVRGPADLAAKTVRAVKQTTAYRNFTVYLVIDSAIPAEALNRLAAGRSEEFLLFLEAGVEPADPRWLSRLVAYLRLPDVGAVGGLIRDAEGRIVSAGTVLGMQDGTVPGDAFGGQKPEPVSYYFYAEVARNVTAPARGCLLTQRKVFDRVGGFDADRFGHTLYDVDFALRLAGQGLRCVQVGGVEFTQRAEHRQVPGAADPSPYGLRLASSAPTEQRALRAAYGTVDPYSNPNLSAWDSFTPRSDAPHLIPAAPVAPLRVLFGTHNLTAFEGAPKILQDVALGLTRRGAVTAAVFAPAPGKAASAFAGMPVFAEDTPFAKRYIDSQWTPAEYEAAQRQLAKLLREFRPHVVLANTLGLFPMIEAAARQNLPGLLAIQESYPEPLFASVFSPFGRWRCERAFLYADRVVFASRSCAELYQRLDGRKNFEVIHNGLSAAPFDEFRQRLSKDAAIAQLPRPDMQHRIVTVGTVCERKAQHVLVEAMAQLARRDVACYLVGAREGLPYLSYVRNLIHARGLDDLVIPITETDSVWTYLRAADVFVCASYVEAFSLSVLEAEAFGLPIVSTPCGGLDEQVVWNRSALKFDFGHADQLADGLQTLLTDDHARAEMGRQSRAAFELRLTADGMLDRYLRTIVSAARLGQSAASRAA